MINKIRDIYFMNKAYDVQKTARCVRRSVGSVIVKDDRIISTGSNGTPHSVTHCTKESCVRNISKATSGNNHDICRGIHSECRTISNAIDSNKVLSNTTLYCTTKPCSMCMKKIIDNGISRVVYSEDYPDKLTEDLIKSSGIEVTRLDINIE